MAATACSISGFMPDIEAASGMQHLYDSHRSHAEDFAHHQVEGAHRRDHHLQHAVVLLLDHRLHDHRAVDQQEHVEDESQDVTHARGHGRRLRLRVLLLRLVVAEGLHVDRGLHLVEDLREVFDVVGLEFLGFEDAFDLPRDVAFEGERRRRVGVEPDVVRVFQDVAADVEHAEFVGQLLAGLLGREFRGLETDLLVVFEFRGHQPAVVDDGDDLLVAPRELHDERRGGHQPDHQHGHQQGGDDEGFFTYALVELALDDDGYVGHDRM